MSKNKKDQMTHLFESLGQLYNQGVNLNLEVLYPAVKYPVPRGTPSISSLMRWDHSRSWLVPKYPEYFNSSKATSDIETTIDLSKEDYKYLTGHIIDGRVLFPATGYVMLAWHAFAQVHSQVWTDCPIDVSDIRLHKASFLPKSGSVVFSTQLLAPTGDFSITEGGVLVASGHIASLSTDDFDPRALHLDSVDEDTLPLAKDHVYKELRVRGYDYGPSFQCIERSAFDGSKAVQRWTGKWVSYADSLIQLKVLSLKDRALYSPVRITSIKCDPRVLSSLEPGSLVKASCNSMSNELISCGLKIDALFLSPVSRKKVAVSHESYVLVPHYEDNVDCEKVDDYIDKCSSVASAILKKAQRQVDAESLYFHSISSLKSVEDICLSVKDDTSQSLLKCLSELFSDCDIDKSNLKQNVAIVHRKYKDGLRVDFLQHSFASEGVLRPMIHLVAENTTSQPLNLLEINYSGNLLATPIAHFAHLKNRRVNYSLLGNGEKNVDNVNVVTWNKGESLSLPPQDLVVYHLSPETAEKKEGDELFTQICSLVNEGSFLLLGGRTRVTQVEKLIFGQEDCDKLFVELMEKAEKAGFIVAANKTNRAGGSLVLLRKKKEQMKDNPSIIGVNSSDFSWLDKLKAAVTEREVHPEKGSIWLINTDGGRSGLLGLVNCLRLEPSGHKIRCIFDKTRESIEAESYAIDSKILELDLTVNVIDENNHRGSYCHLDSWSMSKMVPCENAFLQPLERENLSSLTWIESKLKCSPSDTPASDGQLIHIYYSSLNLQDLMFATGEIESHDYLSESTIGFEAAGRTITGERVMALVGDEAGIATTGFVKDTSLLWPVPDQWSLEEAATVPVAYCTAYYALIIRGSLQRGESVLIPSGTGDFGLAAISICLSMECEVFVTVRSSAMRKYLLEEFPQLKEKNIFNSSSTSFEQDVMASTNGWGVDVVLNPLTDEKLKASVRVSAEYGRFVEVGKYNLKRGNTFEMSVFHRNASFHGVFLDELFSLKSSESYDRHKKMVRRLMEEGIANGTVRPLCRTIFTRDEAEDAFRYMMKAEHIGKVLIQMRHEEHDKLHRPETIKVLAKARTFFYSHKSYIIIGGLGGFGLEMAYWMVTRGARKLILSSRSGVKDAYQNYSIKRLEQYGATVVASTTDAGDSRGTKRLLDEAIALGPVGGIFNLALVLRDKLLVNQTEESFKEVAHCKVTGTINIDTASRVKCPQLDHFVVFSSIISGIGNAGQCNYGLANSVMERICEERRKLNLPGLAIQWGAIADVGAIADKTSFDTEIAGTLPQRIHSCLSALDGMLVSRETIVTSAARRSPMPIAMRQDARGKLLPTEPSSDEEQLTDMVTTKGTDNHLITAICHILGVSDMSSIPLTATLKQHGMDSLMSVQIKETLERDYNTSISMKKLGMLTFEELSSLSRSWSHEVGPTDGHALVKNINHSTRITPVEGSTHLTSSLPAESSQKKSGEPEREPHEDVRLMLILPSDDVEHSVVEKTPLTLMLKNDAGAQALLSILNMIFLIIAVAEEVTNFSSEEEWRRRNNFWYDHFATLPQFLAIWTCIHIFLCLLVYPAGRLMRRRSNILCTFTFITCILLIKSIVVIGYKLLEAINASLSVSLGIAIGLESTRLSLKTISYLVECRYNSVRSQVTLSRFIYFLFAPTLIFKNRYARTPGAINWLKAARYFVKFGFLLYMISLWFKNYVQTIYITIERAHHTRTSLAVKDLANITLISYLTALFTLLASAWGLLDFFQNLFAEILRFADREFYKKWWTAKSIDQVSRLWNYRVHECLEKYVLLPTIDKFGRPFAVWTVFLLSGIYHDLILAFGTGFITPGFTIQMGYTAAMIALPWLAKMYESYDKRFPTYGSFHIIHAGVFFFFGSITLVNLLELHSRTLCPELYPSNISKWITIRFHRCIKF